MYTLVLMTALTAGGETPDFCHRRCSGCCSGYGCYSSCHGCYGCSSCYGCCGGGGYGYGYGSCYGCCSSYGCSSYGCCSAYGGHSCVSYGGGGCYGGLACYGSGYGGLSCYSGCYAAPSWGYNPVPTIGCAYGVPSAPVAPPADLPPAEKEKKDGEASAKPSKGRLVVEVPEDAKVYIDDQLMKTASGTRKYSTPTLEQGQLYYYIVKAEVVRDGKTVTDTKRVVVKAGEESRLAFDKLETVSTAKVDR